jgi:Na+/melibiose symporter-like transporter
MSVGAGGSLMGIFFFLFFSLSSPKHYNLDLFVGGISTSVIILLIFMFCFWSFYI